MQCKCHHLHIVSLCAFMAKGWFLLDTQSASQQCQMQIGLLQRQSVLLQDDNSS